MHLHYFMYVSKHSVLKEVSSLIETGPTYVFFFFSFHLKANLSFKVFS